MTPTTIVETRCAVRVDNEGDVIADAEEVLGNEDAADHHPP